MEQKATEQIPGTVTERRIAWLTLAIGVIAGLTVGILRDRMWGVGLVVGTVLAWLNFSWLRRGLDSLVQASTAQAALEKPRVPMRSYFFAMFRYALIGATVYVIFAYLHVPLASMIVGLCALAVAAIAASVYEIWHPVE